MPVCETSSCKFRFKEEKNKNEVKVTCYFRLSCESEDLVKEVLVSVGERRDFAESNML
jgi:hypothetical protein